MIFYTQSVRSRRTPTIFHLHNISFGGYVSNGAMELLIGNAFFRGRRSREETGARRGILAMVGGAVARKVGLRCPGCEGGKDPNPLHTIHCHKCNDIYRLKIQPPPPPPNSDDCDLILQHPSVGNVSLEGEENRWLINKTRGTILLNHVKEFSLF